MQIIHPVPETNTAFLPSAGLRERRATRHHYDHTAPHTVPARDKTDVPRTGHAHWYRCEETGALRIWGFE